jgi:hypothetical protein
MDEEIRENDIQVLTGALDLLMKHFDTAMVFVTRQEKEGETMSSAIGRGNWYARFGQVQSWLDNGGAMHLPDEDEEGECPE